MEVKVERRTMNGEELAEYLGVSYWKVMEMARTGKIPCIRIGYRRLFRKETIDRWCDEQEAMTEDPIEETPIRRIK